MTLARRSFITGLISLVAAPAIIRAGSLMPVTVMVEPVYGIGSDMLCADIAELNRFGAALWIDWARSAVAMNSRSRAQ